MKIGADAFEDDITPAEEGVDSPAFADAVRAALGKLRVQYAARREFAADAWRTPQDGPSDLLSAQLDLARETPRHLISGLLGWGHNAVLGAQYGAGKTTLALNVARSLVDGVPFLDKEVTEFEGRVGWINAEMDPDDWRDYARPMKFKNADRVAVKHFRDASLPILNDVAAGWLVKWLRDNDVKVLVIDSWRRLCGWNGIDENVNGEVEPLTTRIDEIKAEAGVLAAIVLAHTGRAKAEEGEERVRGATALDDWLDARWVLVAQPEREGGGRFFACTGKRGVWMDEVRVELNRANNRYSLGTGNRWDARNENHATAVLIALGEPGAYDGLSAWALEQQLHIRKGSLAPVLRASEQAGQIHSVPGKTTGVRWRLGPKPLQAPPSPSGG